MSKAKKPKQPKWKPFPMLDPRSQQRKGGISIAPRDTLAWANTTRIMKAVI